MWWQWLIFGLIFLAIPFGLHEMKEYTPKRINQYVAISLQDMLDNIYELHLNFEILKEGKNQEIPINSGIETEKTTLPLNTKEI